MILTYNSFDLATLGELVVTLTHDYEGAAPDAPTRKRTTVKVAVHLFEETLMDNFVLYRRLEEALRTQNAQLVWSDTDTDTVLVDQTASLVNCDLPENEVAWNEMLVINLSFQYYDQSLVTNHLPATFTVPGSAALSLERVTKWSEGYTTSRFSELHSQRSRVNGRVTASGVIYADAALPLAARRAALLALKTRLATALNSKEGSISYGDFTKTVRVEDFTAEVDQPNNQILWNLGATWTQFPNEASYATAELTAATRDDQSGEQHLTLTGKVQSQTSAAARVKMESLRVAALTQHGYTLLSQLQVNNVDERSVSANADGDAFIELSFNFEYRRWLTTNDAVTFQSSAAGAQVQDLGHVTKWRWRYNGRRYSELHSQRQHAGGIIEAQGTWRGDGSAVSRATLKAKAAAMIAAVNAKDGTLARAGGTVFSQIVRVDEFSADVNQAVNGIDWTLNAQYSLFPNEAGYALCELEVQQHESVEDGEQTLAFTGRIQAQTETAARAKLALLRASMLTSYGFVETQQLTIDSSVKSVAADTDGEAFIELSFSEGYRQRKTDVLSWTLKVNDREDFRTGLIVTSYSGTVTASGANETEAYAAALAKAELLGANKYDFVLSSSIGFDQRQTTAGNDIEFVRLDFSYEYQRKDGQLVAIEITAETSTETFGPDSYNVSGYVAAPTKEGALAAYSTTVRALVAGLLVESERQSEAYEVQNKTGSDVTMWLRLDFSLQAHRPKTSGNVTMRYALDTSKNWSSLRQQSTFSGSVFAATTAEAEAFLDGFAGTLGLTGRTDSQRKVDLEYAPIAGGTSSASPTSTFIKLDFTETYQMRLTGLEALLECSVSEDLEYSGVRWVEQPLPDAASLFQNCGIDPGRRTIRASATASTEAVAETWCKLQRGLLSGPYYIKPSRSKEFIFAPITEGVVSGAGANFECCRMTFVFSELLPTMEYA